ncbi:MaoC family dehydratase N-terminal domain-containing protein [Sphingobium sp. H39-3-25]|uniref:FAS1-like dehydratase domain-containing protein n=1 Tax=Sphingobium arseniciresistens TaxID=3030834 RepID=UPI0023B96ACF|nr:MaoC family dehydratase N-terminal domain-containing protein [Sphingobium arseniciresistens]
MSESVLDCSDIDQYLGKPIQSSPLREPLGNNDIRRWVQAMHYPNLLHYDPAYAAESRWGKLVAPQSFPIAMDDGHGTSPSCTGKIPNSHLLFGGDEWWFEGPRVFGGDTISNERIPFDYVVKDTKFAGPTCFQRGDNFYRNQHGELIAKQRSTAIRYLAHAGGESTPVDDFDEPEWTDEEIAALEERKFTWIQMLHDLGHKERWWDDMNVGDALPERVVGPHTVASFATEWRAFLFTIWGTLDRRPLNLADLGFTEEMAGHENDPVMERINPELTDGAYYGASRGHMFPRYARKIGMPRAYGYGASMGSWIIDYFAGWAGEWGLVRHSNCSYRGPALSGDVTITNGTIIDKFVDEEGRHMVQVDCKMTNQKGGTQATAKAEIELPKKK